MKAFKGFDRNLQCRGYQYEIGKTYETDKAELCKCGFHACESPLEPLMYYPPAESRYCEVDLDEESGEREIASTKIVGKKIKVGAELNLLGLARAHVEWVKSNIDRKNKKSNTGYMSVATNTGGRSVATNTGYRSAAEVSGSGSIAMAAGYASKARGSIGCAIVVAERGDWDGPTRPLLNICAAIVDGKKIKADTWYTAKNGELVEVCDDDE